MPGRGVGPFMVSLGIVVGLGCHDRVRTDMGAKNLGVVFVVVVILGLKKDPEFMAKKTIYLSQKKLEHLIALAGFQQVASKPALME